MTTNEAFLHALNLDEIKQKYAASSIRTWRSRAIREKLSLDFMIDFLNENGYKVKQSLLWHSLEGAKNVTASPNKKGPDGAKMPDEKDFKAQLGQKLYAVRKQLSAELYNNWYEWSRAEYTNDYANKVSVLTPVVFSQMTYGRYISKENIPFALKVLKEGKKMLQEYHEYIKQEVENL